MHPLCFVLMPFGKKADASGRLIDFDAVYAELIAPAIENAGLEPIRADEEMTGGLIHKPMYERLLLCPYAVADLTTANANVFYELGIRHAVRPGSTLLLFAEGGGAYLAQVVNTPRKKGLCKCEGRNRNNTPKYCNYFVMRLM